MKRKIFALFLAAVMVLTMLPLTVSAAFTDTAGHWAEGAIDRWSGLGVLNGYSDGTFKPENPIKRGEFFKIIDSVMGYKAIAENRFADLKESDWYYEIVLRLAAAGVVTGDAGTGTVRGEANIKREEAFAVLARVFNVEPDANGVYRFLDADKVSAWARAEVGGMAAAGYVQGFNGYLNPQDPIKRAEVVTVIDNLISLYMGKTGTYSGQGGIAIASADGAVLKDAEFEDLYVTQGVGSGAFTLVNSKITGTLYVSGGGVNSIRIISSDVARVVVSVDPATGDVRIAADDNSGVAVIYVEDGSDDVILDGGFDSVVVEGNSTVTVASGASVGSISVRGDGAGVVVSGQVGTVTVAGSNVSVGGAGRVGKVSVAAGTGNSVTVKGAEVEVASTAGSVSLGGGKTVQPGGKGTVSEASGETGGGSGDVLPPLGPSPASVAKNEVIELSGALVGVGENVFGGTTQLNIKGLSPGKYEVYVKANDPVPEMPELNSADNLLVPELADLIYTPNVGINVWKGIEAYTDFVENEAYGSKWMSSKLMAIPGLADLDSDLVIIAFKGRGLEPPQSIAGFGGAPVDVADLPEGLGESGWFYVQDGDLLLIALYPEPPYVHPVKTTGDTSSNDVYPYLYEWPQASGSYDPALDNRGIKSGTKIYSCYEFNWATYTVSRTWDPPEDIDGYEKAASPADMMPGTWYPLSVGSYSYLLIMGKALLPADRVVAVNIGAQVDGEFKARDTVTIETGKSLNLTALLTATGKNLQEENRAVTWTVARTGQRLSVDEYSARITVIVTQPRTLPAPAIRVNSFGVREWDKDPVEGDVYLGFTSDVHYDKNFTAGESLYRLWMQSLAEKGIQIEYMAMLGDNLSAYSSSVDVAWQNIMAFMELADSFVGADKLVKYDNLFLAGNHEHWTTAGAYLESVRNNPAYKDAVDRIYETGEDPIEEEDYIIVPFGARNTMDYDVDWYSAEYGAGQGFLDEDIEWLTEILADAPADIPIFVLSHYPIHTFVAPEGGDRVTGNAAELIRVLNNYPNVIFLWGHNHSSADPLYDKVLKHGDFITIGPGVYGETIRINFTYAAAGAMNDIDYRSSASSDSMPGGVYVRGKGMLVGISDGTVNLMWYDKPAQEIPTLKLPEELEALYDAAEDMKIWIGAAAYRSYEEAFRSEWFDSAMGEWAKAGSVLGGGYSVVILGFKGEGLGAVAGDIDALTGFDEKAATASALTAGRWGIVVSQDGSMVFVILYTVSDGAIWLPRYIGDVTVLEVKNRAIFLWDGVYDDDPSNWEADIAWEDIVDVVSSFAPVTTDGEGSFIPADGKKLFVGGTPYSVVSGVKYNIPSDVVSFLEGKGFQFFVQYGYNETIAGSNGGSNYSISAIQNITDLEAYGTDVLFIRIGAGLYTGLSDPAQVLPNGIAGYKRISTGSITNNAGFAAVKADFKPGAWFFAQGNSTSYLVIYTYPKEFTLWAKENGVSFTVWYSIEDANANASSANLSTTRLRIW